MVGPGSDLHAGAGEVLQALTSVFRRRHRLDDAQLALPLDGIPRSADELLSRLRSLGLRRIERCQLTRNRNVMVSFRGGELRVHEGYLAAPSDVHQAIVTFVEARTSVDRRNAQRRIVSFASAVHAPSGPTRRERTRPEDEPMSAKLSLWHRRLNDEHFGGALTLVPVRVSRRMKTRLGHYSPARRGEPAEIAIGWRHLRRHGWDEALQTLLHEMVHQWQDETDQPIDHGPVFRAKAREVGITPAARRSPGV